MSITLINWRWKSIGLIRKKVLSPSIIIEEHFARIFEDGEGCDFGSPKHVEDLLGVVLGDFRTPLDGDWTSSSTTFFRVILSRPLPFGSMTKMNKRSKGSHIVHLSTMCNLYEESARAVIFFSDRPEQHKIGRGRCDLASCQVLLNSIQPFQRTSPKCLSQSEARAAILFFRSAKNTNLVEDVKILLPIKFRWIPFSGFRGEVEIVSANQWPGRPSLFFPIVSKNTNLVEGVEILLPVKFCSILFSGFRGEVENVKI